ncbi:hypothetical protein B0H10DRAFT_1675352, partial [Mycena sp. CBHHK59/15]
RFEKQAHLTDLDEAIIWHHKALALQPAPHPSRARCLLNLGISLITMYKQRGATTDLATAICVLREGAGYKSGPPVERLFAARAWSSTA